MSKGDNAVLPRRQPIPRQRLHVIEGDRSVDLLGSDERGRAVYDECRLCLEPALLRLSHIVPRWAYRWMKQEGVPIGTANNHAIVFREQDGRKHYLLCSRCEGYLGEAERYLSLLARGTEVDLRYIGVTLYAGPQLHGINFKLVMRGLLGILYKAHHAPSPPFDKISLDLKLMRRMRDRIVRDDYSTHSLLVFVTK